MEKQYWWVNHKQTYAQETQGGYMWSPTTNANGQRSQFYENMKLVQPGDVIFSYADTAIRAVGIATGSAALLPKPADFGKAGKAWRNQGWRVPVEFVFLKQPFRPRDYMDTIGPTLPKKYSPITSEGKGNQVAYLAALPDGMVNALKAAMTESWPAIEQELQTLLEASAEAEPEQDAVVTVAIENRTDIGETERSQLVKARRGQGIYRKNLESFETHCRITGVAAPEHLRASHIKPWRASTDFEKLDGNNGLLLSPHVDHLFDRGFVSFSEDGHLLVSGQLTPEVLVAWGIEKDTHVGQFRAEQLPYLAFHREFVFKV